MYDPLDDFIEEGFLIVDEEQEDRQRNWMEDAFEIDPNEGFDDEEIPW